MAPDHGKPKPAATTSPSTRSAPCRAERLAVDDPPCIRSEVTCQPAPKAAPTPSSKSAISDASGAGDAAGASSARLRSTE